MSVVPRALAFLAIGVGLFATTGLAAEDYATRKVGDWAVSASTDGKGCFLTRIYDGPGDTTLLLGLDIDGSNRLTVLNANWSIPKKDALKLTFRLSGASFPRHVVVGLAVDGKKGFVTNFGTSFPATFAASKVLNIARGDVPVEELSLDGSGAAVTELRKCVDQLSETPAPTAKARRNGDRIPLDPFAHDAERKAKKKSSDEEP